MKRILPPVVFLFVTNALFAQKELQFTNDSDTAFWYRYKNENVEQFKLGRLENETADYSFRFWSNGLVVKVTSKADKCSGEIIRFVETYSDKKGKKVFTKRYPISSQKAVQVRQLIDSLQIDLLPSDINIKGWQQGLDGITYFTESKTDQLYSFKNYWTPSSQDSLKEAVLFQSFVSELDTILDLRKNRLEFQDEIPFDSWSYPGSATAVIRVKPKSKKRKGA